MTAALWFRLGWDLKLGWVLYWIVRAVPCRPTVAVYRRWMKR